MLFNKLKRYLIDRNYRFLVGASRGLYDKMPDRDYLERMFYAKLGYQLDLNDPRTYNEKLQWLKLNDRKSIYNTMVDKYAAKEYVASILGEEYIIPTIGVWDSFEDIDFSSLPNQFVLKCTHDSGGLVICKDKSLSSYGYYKLGLLNYKFQKPEILYSKLYFDCSISF